MYIGQILKQSTRAEARDACYAAALRVAPTLDFGPETVPLIDDIVAALNTTPRDAEHLDALAGTAAAAARRDRKAEGDDRDPWGRTHRWADLIADTTNGPTLRPTPKRRRKQKPQDPDGPIKGMALILVHARDIGDTHEAQWTYFAGRYGAGDHINLWASLAPDWEGTPEDLTSLLAAVAATGDPVTVESDTTQTRNDR